MKIVSPFLWFKVIEKKKTICKSRQNQKVKVTRFCPKMDSFLHQSLQLKSPVQ